MSESSAKELERQAGSKALQTRRPVNDIEALLASDAFKHKVALALPKHMTPERLIRVACNALLRTPKLRDCSQASFMKALLDLSSFGLEPDGRRAHLIPFGTEVQLIIDYKGLAELVRRSGDVSYIHADVVGKNDEFVYQFGTGARLVHKPKLNDRGQIYCAYSFVRLKDGSEDFDVMGLDEIDKIKERSKSKASGPWVTDENEMRKKTVFRRHSKWLPLSPEIQDAIQHDDEPLTEQERFVASKPIFSSVFADTAEDKQLPSGEPDPNTPEGKDFLGV